LCDGHGMAGIIAAAKETGPASRPTPGRIGLRKSRYQISRAPSCAWRGAPRPLAIVPEKSNTRLVVWGTSRLFELAKLKTSKIGSIDTRLPSANSRDRRRSSDEYSLSLRPVLRSTIVPSDRMRSEVGPNGAWDTGPPALSDSGWAERYE